MKRVVGIFEPLPDAKRTMFATEATFVISKQKQTPGVNVKLKVNEVGENGAPQEKAGRTIFNTFWLTEKTLGMFCQWLDALGFKTDDEGNYLMPDGSIMPDLLTDVNLATGEKYKDKDTLPWLVGIPFVVTTKHSVNEYEKDDGTKGTNDQYRLTYDYTGSGADRKVVTSVHPRKAEAFAVPTQPMAPDMSGTPNF